MLVICLIVSSVLYTKHPCEAGTRPVRQSEAERSGVTDTGNEGTPRHAGLPGRREQGGAARAAFPGRWAVGTHNWVCKCQAL